MDPIKKQCRIAPTPIKNGSPNIYRNISESVDTNNVGAQPFQRSPCGKDMFMREAVQSATNSVAYKIHHFLRISTSTVTFVDGLFFFSYFCPNP